MTKRQRPGRGAAARQAHEAKQSRRSVLAEREARIESALTDYFDATMRAEQIRDIARRKASALADDAERVAEREMEAARDAVRRLRGLLSVQEVAELCGISQWAVRDMLAPAHKPGPDDEAGELPGDLVSEEPGGEGP